MRRREASGWRRVGRKIGFTNRTIWEQYQVFEPMFGYMYDRTTHWVGDRTWDVDGHGPEGSVSLAGLSQPLVEPEVVFRLRETPPVTDDPEALLRCIDWVGHGFEIVQCHFPDWKFADRQTRLRTAGCTAGTCSGAVGRSARTSPSQGWWRGCRASGCGLIKNGSVAATGGGDLVLGSPLNALAYLVKTLAGLPDHPPLQAGEFVTTGTLTAALPTAPGDTWFCRFDGIELPGLVMRCEGRSA